MVEIQQIGNRGFLVLNCEGRLTGKRALALVEAAFDIKLEWSEYECTLDTTTVGKDVFSHALFLRRREL